MSMHLYKRERTSLHVSQMLHDLLSMSVRIVQHLVGMQSSPFSFFRCRLTGTLLHPGAMSSAEAE